MQQISRKEYTLIVLISLFVGIIIVTNIITVKYIKIYDVVLTAGALTYPFTFIFLDITAEIYGKNYAKLMVWTGMIASVWILIWLFIAYLVPIAPNSPVKQGVFQQLLGFTPGIIIGSIVAYLIAQFIDIFLFDTIQRWTKGRHLWLRNNISTLVSQFIDTIIFGLIAWIIFPWIGWGGQVIAWKDWQRIMINEYGFKVIFTLCSTPLVYGGVYGIKFWLTYKVQK